MQSCFRQLRFTAAIAFFSTAAFSAFAQDQKAPAPAEPNPPANAAVEPAAPAPAAAEAKAEAPLRSLTADADVPAPASSARVIRGGNNERIAVGHDSFLGKGESAEAVIAIFGSATSEGEVRDAVVSILGNTRVTGPVGDAAWAVLGNTYVNSRVGDAVVAVLGNVELGPEADVAGDVVSIGGTVTRHPNAQVRGNTQNVAFGHLTPGSMDGLRAWFTQAVLMGRPLAIGPNLGWVWLIAFSLLGLYVLIALLFRPAVEQCVTTLQTRPGYSVLATVLTVLMIPIAIILLCFTVVGIALVPFILMGLVVAALFGKAVILTWIGSRFTRFFGEGPLAHAAVAALLGGIIVTGLYLVPVLGFVVFKLIGWLAVGVVVYTLVLRMKKEARVVVTGPVPAAASTVSMTMTVGEAAVPPPAPVQPPPVISAATLPRAGFWIRVLALLIDVVVVALVMNSMNKVLPGFGRINIGPGLLPVIALYGALLWKLRGTTIGGIVCGLKVVRLDDRPLDWPTAIVRALACFLSLFVAGLGFIWVVFDPEKQSWHDKIAGTTIVRVPKGVSLI